LVLLFRAWISAAFLGWFVEVAPETLVAAVLVTKGTQLLVVQNYKPTSDDLTPTSRTDLVEG
jgi:hypothetical protein